MEIESVTDNSIISFSDVLDDQYLLYLCNFVRGESLDVCDLTVLKSFIKYIFVRDGLSIQYDVLFPNDYDIVPCKHSVIEITSEMMRCNYDLYTECKYRRNIDMLNNIVERTQSKPEIEYDVCGLLYDMLSDSVVTCAGKLLYFVDGIWTECSSDGYLWNYMTKELISYLYSEGVQNIASHIKSVHTRGRILKDIKLRLQDDMFEDLLDSKRDLICMMNGVINTKSLLLSNAVPSDYVSVKAGVSYEIFDETSSQLAELLHILNAIFTHEDILDFFIRSCATFLEGFNPHKVFYIWWGTGNNAKSLIQTLVISTFGQYCSTAPTSLITGKRTSSSNATPELCHVEKRLVVFLQEPNPDEKIRAGVLKEMTGNDSMYTRQLFKSGKTMMFKAKLVLVCNNIIEIPGMDAALRRRIIVIPFLSTFLNAREYNVRSSKGTLSPDSRVIDPTIEKRLVSCSSAFMYLLCKKHNESINKEFHVPQIIQDTTEEYLTRNNYPLIFIRQFLHTVNGCLTATTEIYEMFKEWFKRSYPGKRVVDLEVFTSEIESEGYKDNGQGIIENVFVSYNGDLISHND